MLNVFDKYENCRNYMKLLFFNTLINCGNVKEQDLGFSFSGFGVVGFGVHKTGEALHGSLAICIWFFENNFEYRWDRSWVVVYLRDKIFIYNMYFSDSMQLCRFCSFSFQRRGTYYFTNLMFLQHPLQILLS